MKVSKLQGNGPFQILLIGNNAIELSDVLDKLHQVRKQRIVTEIAFDFKGIVERLVSFHPNFILMDDNIGKTEMLETVNKLSANRKTKDVPITVIKNSNYKEALPSSSIIDYLLKKEVSADSLYLTLRNGLRFKNTQQYLSRMTKKRRMLSLKKDQI